MGEVRFTEALITENHVKNQWRDNVATAEKTLRIVPKVAMIGIFEYAELLLIH